MTRIKEIFLTIAKRIGRIQTWLIFTLFYFVVMSPLALLFKCFADPLHLRSRSSLWRSRVPPADPLGWGKTQS